MLEKASVPCIYWLYPGDMNEALSGLRHVAGYCFHFQFVGVELFAKSVVSRHISVLFFILFFLEEWKTFFYLILTILWTN